MTDGRLLLPAAGAWLGALSVELLGPRALLVAVFLSVSSIAVIIRPVRRVPASLVLPSMGCLVVGALAATLHVGSLTAEPLAAWTRARATATVVAVVTTEPVRRTSRARAAWQDTTRVEVRLATASVRCRGVVIDVEVPLVLRVGEEWNVPAPGSTIVIIGRLGPTSSADVAGTITPIADGLKVISGPGWLDAWAHAMRIGLRVALDGTSPDSRALVAGLAVGDETLQSDELAAQMRASGLSHLTAVSGGNVAIVVVVVVGTATLVGLSLLGRVMSALAALALFVVLVGPQPSVLRAAVMGAVVLAGLLVGGRRAGPSVLGTSVLVLVIVSPSLARSWGFALSVGATAGLILLAPRLQRGLQGWPLTSRWPPALRDAIAITGAAQLATLPLLVLMGASVGWVALPANLLAMPVVPAVTVLGLGAAVTAPLIPPLAHGLAVAASWPAGWIAGVARAASELPLPRMPVPSGAAGLLVLAAIAVAGWLGRRWSIRVFPQRPPRRLLAAAGATALLLGSLWLVLPAERRSWPPSDWFLIMCDVGQGDAILLRSGAGSAVVVDTGPEPSAVDSCLSAAGISEVPAVVLTHFHADHVEGLPGVLRGRRVGAVLVTPVRDPPEEAEFVDSVLADIGLSTATISAGDERQVGQVRWHALWPRRVITSGSIPNNTSLVLSVSVAGRAVLLTGDIESEAQLAVLPEIAGRAFDVVKVPHHGSGAQSPVFATQVRAHLALVSVGAGNPYGHPAPETIAAWRAIGALVARTDEVGDVAVVTTPTGVAVVARGGMLPS